MKKNSFAGRSLSVISDLTRDEQFYLFDQVIRLKKITFGVRQGENLNPFKINDPNFGIQLIFLEDSTRTQNSFSNAAKFHGIEPGIFNVAHSSLNKHESLTDTIQTLLGYGQKIFVIRSKVEGACTWLAKAGHDFAMRNNLGFKPSFINAGDGRHEHPTQELLDEFTFWEQNGFKSGNIHIALIGDLLHGRTVHSKAEGLKIFTNVKVDLIAPKELAMPDNYLELMKNNNFELRFFGSIEEYLNQNVLASIWYFTRPQLERMGEDILRRQDELREKITFKKEFLSQISANVKFYHPLPRNKNNPEIPFWLDSMPFNGWENQSINGYLIRIILLAAFAGKIGQDFQGEIHQSKEYIENFILEKEVNPNSPQKVINEGINPIREGVVIDHICKGESPEQIWDYLIKIQSIMGLFNNGYMGVCASRQDGKIKGIMSLPKTNLSDSQIKMLAAVVPGCTVNIVKDGKIFQKLLLQSPPRIYGFDGLIRCQNEACISRPEYYENVPPEFIRRGGKGDLYRCLYCDHTHTFKKIWV